MPNKQNNKHLYGVRQNIVRIFVLQINEKHMKRLNKFSANKIDSDGRPYKVIPKRKRLAIYKKLLAETQEFNNEQGLCILLAEKAGLKFSSSPDSDLLFPEFGEHIDKHSPTKFLNLCNGRITSAWRIAVLENCIKLCNTNIM